MSDTLAEVTQQLRSRLAVVESALAEHDALVKEAEQIRAMLGAVPSTNGRATKGQLQDAILHYFTTDTETTLAPDSRAIEFVVTKFSRLSHAKDPERAVRASIAGLIKAGKLVEADGFLRAAK